MTTNQIHPPRAYRDPEFMNSPEARPVRILAEYLEPQERFEEFNIKDTILVFGSARLLPRDEAEKRLEAAKARGHQPRVLDTLKFGIDNIIIFRRLLSRASGLRRITALFTAAMLDSRPRPSSSGCV